jgi:hypothetical protein
MALVGRQNRGVDRVAAVGGRGGHLDRERKSRVTYRLTITLADGRMLTEFSADELSGLAWPDEDRYAPNVFNNYGDHHKSSVRHVTITGSEPPTRARASWYRKYRS